MADLHTIAKDFILTFWKKASRSLSGDYIKTNWFLEKVVPCLAPEKYSYSLALKNKKTYLDNLPRAEKWLHRKLSSISHNMARALYELCCVLNIGSFLHFYKAEQYSTHSAVHARSLHQSVRSWIHMHVLMFPHNLRPAGTVVTCPMQTHYMVYERERSSSLSVIISPHLLWDKYGQGCGNKLTSVCLLITLLNK